MKKLWFLFLFILAAAMPSLVLGNGSESAFDGLQPLTEQEEKEANDYIHDGIAEKTLQDMCGQNQDKCTSEDAFKSGSSMAKVEAMMPIVTKAYAFFSSGMVMGQGGVMGGGGVGNKMPVNVEENGHPVKVSADGKSEYTFSEDKGGYVDKEGNLASKEDLEGTKDKTKERTDYCGYLPLVVEGVSMAYQMTQNEKTQENYNNAQPAAQQKASFEALAKMHDDRAKSAEYQAAGWGAVAACYTVDAMAFGAVKDWKLIAKIAASTLITTFYVKKAGAHEDRADDLRTMASRFPSPGDCNPHTETTCFCAEESSYESDRKNYMKYCVAQSLHRDNDIAGYPCADKNGKPDNSCKCKEDNSCLEARMTAEALRLGLNPAAMKDPMAGIRHLSSGHGGAKLNDITRGNLAMARKGLKSITPREKLRIGSNSKVKGLAKDLLAAGLPKMAAAALAKETAGLDGALPPGLSASVAPLNRKKDKNGAIAAINRGKNQMESGDSLKGSNSSSRRRSSNPFARRKSSSRSKASSVDIMNFAEQATREAQISKDKGRPIFEIITYRYKMRAWKEFKDEMKSHMDEGEK